MGGGSWRGSPGGRSCIANDCYRSKGAFTRLGDNIGGAFGRQLGRYRRLPPPDISPLIHSGEHAWHRCASYKKTEMAKTKQKMKRNNVSSVDRKRRKGSLFAPRNRPEWTPPNKSTGVKVTKRKSRREGTFLCWCFVSRSFLPTSSEAAAKPATPFPRPGIPACITYLALVDANLEKGYK